MLQVDRFRLVDGSYQHSLLRDTTRLDAFAKAIAQVVRPGDVVADLGSGSGVLAHLALRAGAARVHAVEEHRGALANLRALLAGNGIAERVQVHHADAERWVPPEAIDVVLVELMETGLLHEPSAAVVRNLHTRWPRKPRAVLPARVRLLAEGVRLHDSFHDYAAPLPGFRVEGNGEAVTEAACYLDLDFEHAAPPPRVEARFTLRALREGELHALRLRTTTDLAPGIALGPSPAYCVPVVLPLPAPLRVRAGQELLGALSYGFELSEEPIRFGLMVA